MGAGRAAVGPDLQVSKYALWPFEPLVEPGGVITFSVRVENIGTAQAQNVLITDTLPAELTFEGAENNLCDAPCPFTINGQQVIWQRGNVPADTRWQNFILWARVNSTVTIGAFVTNTVEIGSASVEIDGNPNDDITDPYANNVSRLAVEIVPPLADLQVYKYIGAGVAAAAGPERHLPAAGGQPGRLFVARRILDRYPAPLRQPDRRPE